MELYERLKQVIAEANPEIMELKFGCQLKDKEGTWKFVGPVTFATGEYISVWRDQSGLGKGRLEEFKVLGRPIRLADVLLALGKRQYEVSFNEASNTERVVEAWNLKDDNLDNQSKETKQFLIELLVK
jgi:hypothetical protein